MKKFGFMLMVAAVAAFAFSSCEKKNDPIIVPPVEDTTEVKLPAVEETAGAVTLVIKFDQAPCEGYDILFVGDYGEIEAAWNFAAAKKFEAIGEGWYKIALKPNADGNISGRPIQGKDGEADWSWDWSHSGADIVALKNVGDSEIKDSGYGEINLAFTADHAADAVVAFIQCKKWNKMPCAAASQYNITVKLPEFCEEEFAVEVVGSFEGWGTTPVALVKGENNVYTATITAMEGDQWKVRGEGGWDKEIQGFVTDETSEAFDTWIGVSNNVLGAELNVTMDYSDPAKYRWNVCAEPEEEEEEPGVE